MVEHLDNSEHGASTVSMNIVCYKYFYILVIYMYTTPTSRNLKIAGGGGRGLLEVSLVPRGRVTN